MLTDEQLIDDAPLTSQALQQRHEVVYRHLFERCATVLSAPLAIALTGDRSLSSREASVIIQLPRRMWVGFEHASGESPSLGSFVQYDVRAGQFTEALAHERDAIERTLPHLQPQFHGTRIHVLSETQGGRSLAVSGTLSAILSAAASLQTGVLSAADVDAWYSSRIAPLLGDPRFVDVVHHGRELQHQLRPGQTLGSSVLSALNAEPTQCAAFAGEKVLAAFSAVDLGAASNVPSTWPVDIAVIASGARNDLGLQQEVVFEDATLRTLLASLRTRVPSDAPLVAPLRSTAEELATDVQEHTFLHVFGAWMELWSHGEREESVARLLAAVRQREAFSTAMEKLHPAIRETLDAIHVNLVHRRHAAFPLCTGSHGGTVLLLIARDEARACVPRIVADLRSHGLTGASIDYLSWRDGGATGPLRLEQHLASQHLSRNLPPNALRYTRYDQDRVTTVLRSRNDGIPGGLDVVVDAEMERIYVAGEGVTSHEIPSQRATCELLRRLLPTRDASVASTVLPRSSYRSSRSEMAGKVLTPFSQIVQARTGKACRFTTHGSIADYTICADLRALSIGVLEPCFPPERP